MHLIKETFHGSDFEHNVKEYNGKGLLTLEDNGYAGFWSSKRFFYDDKGRITKILETNKTDRGNSLEEKFVHKYEYSGENYRVISYKTEKRDNYDIVTYENLVLGVEKWNTVDEVFSIQEYKFQNGFLVSEKYHNVESGENHSLTYVYEYDQKILETKTKTNGCCLI